jgi:hypothetical protein
MLLRRMELLCVSEAEWQVEGVEHYWMWDFLELFPQPCQARGRSISKKCGRRSIQVCPKCGGLISPAEVRRSVLLLLPAGGLVLTSERPLIITSISAGGNFSQNNS